MAAPPNRRLRGKQPAHAVKLHAACHEGYATMYAYTRHPSPHKPLSEIDTEAFFSAQHPQREVLKRLILTGARATCAHMGRRKRSGQGNDTPERERFRSGELLGSGFKR